LLVEIVIKSSESDRAKIVAAVLKLEDRLAEIEALLPIAPP